MSDCESIEDRMPGVVHGRDAWTAADIAHLGRCDDCAAEWRLVQAGGQLDAGVNVSADRIAAAVLRDLRQPAAAPRRIRRWAWRGAGLGLLAAAASLALIVLLPRSPATVAPTSADVTTLSVLPELQSLDDDQLEEILTALDQNDVESTAGPVPRLGDLTDSELEQLLRSEGGE